MSQPPLAGVFERARSVHQEIDRKAAVQPRALGVWPLLGWPLLLLLVGLYAWAMHRGGPLFALAAVGLAGTFVATLLVLEIGLGVLILSMLLSPELTVASVGVRNLTLRIEDLLIPVVALAWLARKALGIERRELRSDPILPMMAAFVALQVVSSYLGSALAGLNLAASLLYILKGIEYFAIFYFALQYVDTERRISGVLMLAMAAALLVSLYNYFLIPGNQVWTTHRISAPFEGSPEPSSIGAYFVLVLAMLLALALEAREPRTRHWLLAAFGVVFLPFLFTLSRTSYAAFLVMVLLMVWLSRNATLAAVLGLALLLSPLVLPDPVIDRILFTFRNPHRVLGVFDSSFGERIYIWKKVLWNLRLKPLLGHGVTYHDVIDSYYARLLIETGVFGLLAFALIVGRLFVLAGRVRRHHPAWWARGIALGYTAGLVALLVHATSAVTFLIVRVMEPFWLLSGVVAALAHQCAAADPGPPPPVESPTPPPPSPASLRRRLHG